MFKKLMILGLLCVPALTHAFYPVNGLWYNPDESGRGINIEMHNDVMVATIYLYADDGSPLWWQGVGTLNSQTGVMEASFGEFHGGQCQTCAYVQPSHFPEAGGDFTLEFHSAISATMTWDGGQIPLVKSTWTFSTLNSLLYGEFHYTQGALGIYFGDRLRYVEPFVNSDNVEYVAGYRSGASGRVLLGSFDNDLELFVVLVDSSQSYYQLYVFDMSADRKEGVSWTYEKSDSPSGSGLPFIAHRSASRAYVQTGSGPHSPTGDAPHAVTSTAEQTAQEGRDLALYQLQQQSVSDSEITFTHREFNLVDITSHVKSLEREMSGHTAR